MEEFVATQPGSPVEKLRALLSRSILDRMSGGARLRVLEQLAADMPPKIKQHFEGARRRILDLHAKLIEEGIATAELRAVDPRTAALAISRDCGLDVGGLRRPEENRRRNSQTCL